MIPVPNREGWSGNETCERAGAAKQPEAERRRRKRTMERRMRQKLQLARSDSSNSNSRRRSNAAITRATAGLMTWSSTCRRQEMLQQEEC